MMFGNIISQVFSTWILVYFDDPIILLIPGPKILHIYWSRPLFLYWFVYNSNSTFIVTMDRCRGWGCPIFCKANQSRINSCVFKKSAPSSASAADAATCFKMLDTVCTAPLRDMGLLLTTFLPEKNFLPLYYEPFVCLNMMHQSVLEVTYQTSIPCGISYVKKSIWFLNVYLSSEIFTYNLKSCLTSEIIFQNVSSLTYIMKYLL